MGEGTIVGGCGSGVRVVELLIRHEGRVRYCRNGLWEMMRMERGGRASDRRRTEYRRSGGRPMMR